MSRSAPAAEAPRRPITKSEARALFAPFATAPVVALAVSGGPDSLAMLLLAARWRGARRSGPRLVALTVDHGLRLESAKEARMVARVARSLGVPHRTLRWRGGKPKTGIQEAAREARYDLMIAAARRAGATHLLVAHTQDDQAETVLFRMARGSGLKGLAGMQSLTNLNMPLGSPSSKRGETTSPSRATRSLPRKRMRVGKGAMLSHKTPMASGTSLRVPSDSIYLARPLLHLQKARLIATLKAARIPFAEDPSNHDPRFTRVRWRALAPALAAEGLTGARLATLAARLARADAAIEATVDKAWSGIEMRRECTELAINATAWRALPDEVALRFLGRMIARVGTEGPVELAKLERLFDALAAHAEMRAARAPRFARTLAGAAIVVRDGVLSIAPAPPRRETGRPGAKSAAGSLGKGENAP